MTTDQAKCRWCDQIHGPTCPTVKAIEFFEDGTVKRVEFKTATDYAVPLAHLNPSLVGPSPYLPPIYVSFPPITYGNFNTAGVH